MEKYKIKGLPDEHIAQTDFDNWMHKKICSYCGCEHKLYTFNSQECSHCHSREPFIERWKWYEKFKTS